MGKNITMTVRSLITRSAMLAKVVGQGENLSSEEAFNALQTLNELLDKWRMEKMMISGYNVYELPLTGKDFYTIGEGGDVDYFKPSFGLENVYLVQDERSYPIETLQISSYNDIAYKNETMGRAKYVYFENGLNMAKLYVYPKTSKGKLILTFDKVFSLFESLDSVISFPPAYMRAFRYALAVELCREYGVPEDPLFTVTVLDAKDLIKTANLSQRLPELSLDLFHVPSKRFNVYTGE